MSSTNPSDDFKIALRAPGSLDLNLGGLSSSAIVQLRDETGKTVLKNALPSDVSQGKVTFSGLTKGNYIVHVELPTNSSSPTSGIGGSGGTGSTGSSGGSTSVGGNPSSNSLYIYGFSYSGSITEIEPGSGPLSFNLGDSISGNFEIRGDGALLSYIATSFSLNGENLSFGSGRTSFGNTVDPAIGLSVVLRGVSNRSPIAGQVALDTLLVGPLLSQPAGTSTLNLQRGSFGYSPSDDRRNDGYRGASSNNILLTGLASPDFTIGSGSLSGLTGSGSIGSGSEFSNGADNTGNNSTPFTLTLTADYAGNDLTTADKEIILSQDKINPINSKYTGTFQDWIGSTDPVDLYRFQVVTPRDRTHSGANVSVKVSGLPVGVTVLSVVKGDLSPALTYNIQTDSWIGILGEADSLSKPTDYYIKVTSTVDTNYTLNVDLTETPLTTNLTYTTTGKTKFLTNLWKFDTNGKTSTVGIDPTKPTVVIIHGWNKSGSIQYETGDSLADLAKTIATKYATEQVLALDWGEAATDKGPLGIIPFTAAGRIKGVATWTKDELTALGFNFSKLTLIGHSLGSYVAAVIGVLGDKVGSLYALDPAGDPLSLFRAYNLDSANKGNQVIPAFKSAALRSYAFYSSYNPFAGGIADSRLKAKTADQAFALTYTGDTENNFNPIARSTLYHFAGINVFADLVSQQLFLIDPSNNLTLTNPRSLRKKKGSFNIKRPDNSGLIDKLTYMIA